MVTSFAELEVLQIKQVKKAIFCEVSQKLYFLLTYFSSEVHNLPYFDVATHELFSKTMN